MDNAGDFLIPVFNRSVLNELCSGRQYEDYRKARTRMLWDGAEKAIKLQNKIGEEVQHKETRYVDGIGQHRATIDPFLFAAMELRRGRNWWRDKKTFNKFLKENPQCAVPVPASKYVSVNGFRK